MAPLATDAAPARGDLRSERLQSGTYLTDGDRLLCVTERLPGRELRAGGVIVEVEDCRTLERFLASEAELIEAGARIVDPAAGREPQPRLREPVPRSA
ncbi:MAG TPA: hypothetical protein VK919_10220 [Solirubrobacterales bacterium]|nr:hypothetical protein [Solirubrobacterales bacterium]